MIIVDNKVSCSVKYRVGENWYCLSDKNLPVHQFNIESI